MKSKKTKAMALTICMVLLVAMSGTITASASTQSSDGIITVSEGAVPIAIAPESSTAGPIDGWNMDKTVNTGASYGAKWFGMKYTPTISYNLKRVELIAGKGTGKYVIQLRPDAVGRPHSTSVLRETSFTQVSTVSWQGADFAASYPISAGTTYWIVIKPVPDSQASVATSGTIITHYWGDVSTLPSGPYNTAKWMAKFYAEGAPPEKPTIFVETDKFKYHPGDKMLITIYVSNPTKQSVTFKWFLGVPTFGFWMSMYKGELPPGFEDTFEVPFPIEAWEKEPFSAVWYVDLQDPETGQELVADCACWSYCPLETPAIPTMSSLKDIRIEGIA